MKKIVLLRHGESAWNKENRFTGWTDVDLTEKGQEAYKNAASKKLERIPESDAPAYSRKDDSGIYYERYAIDCGAAGDYIFVIPYDVGNG